MDNVKILFLAADPSDSTRLRLGQELRDIRDNLQRSKERDSFLLESRESVRTGDITQAIFDVEPQIVHFSGHGMSTGELCFEDMQGKTQPVQPDALASLFELVSEQISCVVLNACYSEIQAKAISRYIPFVLGMNQAIGDKTAITFAVGFYKALGAGRSVKDAYKFARVEIQLEGVPDHLTPVLYLKKDKANLEEISDTQKTLKSQEHSLDVEAIAATSKDISSSNNFLETKMQRRIRSYLADSDTEDFATLVLSNRTIQVGARVYQIHHIADISMLKLSPNHIVTTKMFITFALLFLICNSIDSLFTKIVAWLSLYMLAYGVYERIAKKPSYAIKIETYSGSQLIHNSDKVFIEQILAIIHAIMDEDILNVRYVVNLKSQSIQLEGDGNSKSLVLDNEQEPLNP